MNYIRAGLRFKSEYGTKKVPESVPVYLIWGTQDGALNKEMATLSGNYAGNLKIKFIEGASHWVQQDEPKLVNEYIWNFLQGKLE